MNRGQGTESAAAGTTARGSSEAAIGSTHLRPRGVVLDDPLRLHVRRKLERRLGRFAHDIERVSVRVTDVNGPRGGVDRACRVTIVLRHMETVVVERQHHDARASFDLALDAARRSVRARIRRRWLEARRAAHAQGQRRWSRVRSPAAHAPARTETPGRAVPETVDERVDDALCGTFPASDPPPWTLGPPGWTRPNE